MKPSLLTRIQNRYGACPRAWGLLIEARGQSLPCLTLPADQLHFSSEQGFWPHFKSLTDELGRRWFVLQLCSFELARGPGHGWAIPLAYEPRDEDERICKELGFDEGWEESRWENLLLFDQSWQDFFAMVAETELLALSVEGAQSAYPIRFQSSQLDELKRVCR